MSYCPICGGYHNGPCFFAKPIPPPPPLPCPICGACHTGKCTLRPPRCSICGKEHFGKCLFLPLTMLYPYCSHCRTNHEPGKCIRPYTINCKRCGYNHEIGQPCPTKMTDSITHLTYNNKTYPIKPILSRELNRVFNDNNLDYESYCPICKTYHSQNDCKGPKYPDDGSPYEIVQYNFNRNKWLGCNYRIICNNCSSEIYENTENDIIATQYCQYCDTHLYLSRIVIDPNFWKRY